MSVYPLIPKNKRTSPCGNARTSSNFQTTVTINSGRFREKMMRRRDEMRRRDNPTASETRRRENEKDLCRETWDKKFRLLMRQESPITDEKDLSRETWEKKVRLLMRQDDTSTRRIYVVRHETRRSKCRWDETRREWDGFCVVRPETRRSES